MSSKNSLYALFSVCKSVDECNSMFSLLDDLLEDFLRERVYTYAGYLCLRDRLEACFKLRCSELNPLSVEEV